MRYLIRAVVVSFCLLTFVIAVAAPPNNDVQDATERGVKFLKDTQRGDGSWPYAGKAEEAQTYLDQALQLALERQYLQLPAIGERLQGRIWQAQGRFDEAQPCFEHSLARLRDIDDVVEYARSEEAYGLYYLERKQDGDVERGQALLKNARETYKLLGVNG